MVRKKKQPVQEVPIDKVEDFMLQNYKKIVMVVGACLLVFVAVYTVRQIMAVSSAKADSEIGTTETKMALGSANAESLAAFKALADKKSASKNYIYLKAGIIEANNNLPDAQKTLSAVNGELGELAKGLAYDLGARETDPKTYITSGNMKPLWYYRAVLASQGEEKAKLLEEFGAKYPENELYDMVKRWES
ncbi:hypothetical protein EP073_06550 [Geovibrio thiophilus]|uniref:Tetratricopeptide repeat protein n=1 Tax=Geovibrio thiophilus TaxID=139438 RepID=A0A410JYD0_9BACT|nr:hypothetical protein [Geovibrio thiophilus]QAR33075.1 hypothetical protein EP073_06550 [Geovibrio thiophilus]